MTCSNPIGVFFTQDSKEIPAPCGKWSCPECSKVKKNKVLDRANKGFLSLRMEGRRIRSLTLTLGPKADNRKLGKYFARFRAYLAKPRRTGKTIRSYRRINYFWTKEYTQKGKLHMHVLIDAYIPIRLIREAWQWATYQTSHVVFITSLRSEIQKPAGYMTKYMAKAIDKGIIGHRFGFSRYSHFRPVKRANPEKWQLHFGVTTIVNNPIAIELYNLKVTTNNLKE